MNPYTKFQAEKTLLRDSNNHELLIINLVKVSQDRNFRSCINAYQFMAVGQNAMATVRTSTRQEN
jgi:hypothetical protein